MSSSTKCQRCGHKQKSNYGYEPCPVCNAPMLFTNFFEEVDKKDKKDNL